MKGLLKNFRYIFQIFEEEEEEDKEMQIGLPTDVKHVAHIGWDGPSVNSPSWMNEFKSSAPGNASSTLPNGDTDRDVEEVDWGSQDSTSKRSIRESPGRDLPNLPKSSRRQPSVDSIGSIDSSLESPTHKTKSSKRRSKKKEKNSPSEIEPSDSQDLPNIPKKSRRKKSKDNGDGSVKSSSSKSKEKGSRHGSRHGSDDGSITKKYNAEEISNSGLVYLKEEEVKG